MIGKPQSKMLGITTGDAVLAIQEVALERLPKANTVHSVQQGQWALNVCSSFYHLWIWVKVPAGHSTACRQQVLNHHPCLTRTSLNKGQDICSNIGAFPQYYRGAFWILVSNAHDGNYVQRSLQIVPLSR